MLNGPIHVDEHIGLIHIEYHDPFCSTKRLSEMIYPP